MSNKAVQLCIAICNLHFACVELAKLQELVLAIISQQSINKETQDQILTLNPGQAGHHGSLSGTSTAGLVRDDDLRRCFTSTIDRLNHISDEIIASQTQAVRSFYCRMQLA